MVRPALSTARDTLSFNLNSPEVQALMHQDNDMRQLIEAVGEVEVDVEGDGFLSLARAIVDQQISIHAARAIWGRLEVLCEGRVTPAELLDRSIDELRQVGLSRSKAAYLQDLARHDHEKLIDFTALQALGDEEVVAELIQIKGVGRWTAQMHLIFALKRLDVFAVDDGGLRRSVCALKGLESNVPKELIEDIAYDWKPYRTVASLYLWRGLGQGVVQSLK